MSEGIPLPDQSTVVSSVVKASNGNLIKSHRLFPEQSNKIANAEEAVRKIFGSLPTNLQQALHKEVSDPHFSIADEPTQKMEAVSSNYITKAIPTQEAQGQSTRGIEGSFKDLHRTQPQATERSMLRKIQVVPASNNLGAWPHPDAKTAPANAIGEIPSPPPPPGQPPPPPRIIARDPYSPVQNVSYFHSDPYAPSGLRRVTSGNPNESVYLPLGVTETAAIRALRKARKQRK